MSSSSRPHSWFLPHDILPSPTSNYFQQQAAYNPFAQQQMMTGAAFGQQPQVQVQATGMFQPQQPTNPFGLQQQHPQQSFGGSFLQAQPTAFLQPQGTGAPNPFRQSMLMPSMTGMPSFGGMGVGLQAQATSAPTNPFPVQPQQTNNPFPGQPPAQNAFGQNPFPGPTQGTNPFPNATQGQGSSLFGGQQGSPPSQQSGPSSSFFSSGPISASPSSAMSFTTSPAQPVPSFGSSTAAGASASPPRPASAPLRANTVGETLQPVKSHQTGSRNPFGVPVTPAPPVPKVPTLMELAMGFGNNTSTNAQQQPTQTGALSSSPTGFNVGAGGQTSMSGVASSFAIGNDKNPSRSNTMPLMGSDTGATSSTTTGSTFSSSLFSSLSPQTTATSASTAPNGFGRASSPGTNPSISIFSVGSTQPLQSQPTGFGGIKPFKPSSSFGAALLDSLPSIPQSPNESPNASSNALGTTPNPTGSFGTSTTTPPFSSGLTTGVGLRPQATGMAGAANPFRASMFTQGNNPTGGAPSAFGGLGSSAFGNSSSSPSLGNTPTGFMGSGGAGAGSNMFGGAFGSGQNASNGQQQQNGYNSLI